MKELDLTIVTAGLTGFTNVDCRTEVRLSISPLLDYLIYTESVMHSPTIWTVWSPFSVSPVEDASFSLDLCVQKYSLLL